jgi:hypothetical protein
MVKLLVGMLAVTAIAVSSGFAAAYNKHNPIPPDLAGYTKDQCKNGGWETFGFQNQGQCVSYFASAVANATATTNVTSITGANATSTINASSTATATAGAGGH